MIDFYCIMRLSPVLPPVYQVTELTFAAERQAVVPSRGKGRLVFFFLSCLSAEAEPSSHQLNWFHCGTQPYKLI